MNLIRIANVPTDKSQSFINRVACDFLVITWFWSLEIAFAISVRHFKFTSTIRPSSHDSEMLRGNRKRSYNCYCIRAHAWVWVGWAPKSVVTCDTGKVLRTDGLEHAGKGLPPASGALANVTRAIAKVHLLWSRFHTGKLRGLYFS